jgi:hypothetical protein
MNHFNDNCSSYDLSLVLVSGSALQRNSQGRFNDMTAWQEEVLWLWCVACGIFTMSSRCSDGDENALAWEFDNEVCS